MGPEVCGLHKETWLKGPKCGFAINVSYASQCSGNIFTKLVGNRYEEDDIHSISLNWFELDLLPTLGNFVKENT